MTYHSHRRRRRMKRGTLVLLLLLISVFLASCVAGSNPLWVRGLFGFDFANYRGEAIQETLPTDGAVATQLCDMVDVLTLRGNSLEPFSSTSQAVRLYRDAVLNDMLRDDYLRYAGSSAQLSSRSDAYAPTLSMMIPEEDFENAVYRYFGGTAVSHRDGEVFRYMRNAGGYTAPVQAKDPAARVLVTALEETAHTYRMTFRLICGEEQSELYRAVFVKREDSSCYFYALYRA